MVGNGAGFLYETWVMVLGSRVAGSGAARESSTTTHHLPRNPAPLPATYPGTQHHYPPLTQVSSRGRLERRESMGMWWVVGVVVSTVWCQWVRCRHPFPFLQGNYKIYRDKLGTTELPAVPYVGVFLKDLTFICDGNPDYLRGGLINIHKRRQVRKE